MKNFYIFFLIFLPFCLASMAQQPAQKHNDIPKGIFSTLAYISDNNTVFNNFILLADAEKIASEWEINGFSLNATQDGSVLSTGKYAPNAALTATSPLITLPDAEGGDKLWLTLDEAFDTEYHYDFVRVLVSLDGTQSGKVIYAKTGKTGRVTDYIDLTRYAGKSLRLTLQLTADESFEGAGWTLFKLAIGVEKAATAQIQTRASSSSSIAKITVSNVNTDKFPGEILISFTVEDAAGNHISGLTKDDFIFGDDALNIADNATCFNLTEANESNKPAVDLFFIFDNSASMDTHINQVKNALHALTAELYGRYDLRVGLMRFGIGTGTPASTLCLDENIKLEAAPDGSGYLWYIDTENRLKAFQRFIEDHTTTDGFIEQGWEALKILANTPVNYRNNAKKAFVLLGDEPVRDGSNTYDYCGGTRVPLSTTQNEVIELLQDKGVQAFMIIADNVDSYSDYAPIATATGGETQNIFSNDYSSLMTKIANKISGRYILSYCLSDTVGLTPEVCRSITIESAENSSVQGEKCYIPQVKSITRTPETEALDKTSQPRKTTDVEVGVTVCAEAGVDSVVLHYKTKHESLYHTLSNTDSDSENPPCWTYLFTIPALAVDSPLVEYKFNAFLKDGSMLVSIPPNQEYQTWTFAVAPNFPPVISDVQISGINSCDEITVRAKITDTTEYLVKKQLHYRINRTASEFISMDMTPCDTCGNDVYEARIPASAVSESGLLYYIYTTDNHGAQGWYGSPENPVYLSVAENLPDNGEERATMLVEFNREAVLNNCAMLRQGDILRAYFMNDCGRYQIGGEQTVPGGSDKINLLLYGSSQTTGKDGFDEDELVQFRILRDGYEYVLSTLGAAVVFETGGNRTVNTVYKTMDVPGIEISYFMNGRLIPTGDTEISAAKGTDFGQGTNVLRAFSISNTGCATLTIKDILLSDNVNFSIVSPNTMSIKPDTVQEFGIIYKGAATATAKVTVHNNAVLLPDEYIFPGEYTFLVSGRNNATPTFDPEMVVSDTGERMEHVTFLLDRERMVTIKIYDSNNNLMKVIFGPQLMIQGNHSVYFQTTDFKKDIYYCIMESEGYTCKKDFKIK